MKLFDKHKDKIRVDGEHWIWIATIVKGYGQVKVNGKTKYAHIAFYEEENGPVPYKLKIDHLCRKTNCVNPKHMEAVTQLENVFRGKRIKLNQALVDFILVCKDKEMNGKEITKLVSISHHTVCDVMRGELPKGLRTKVKANGNK